MPIFDHLHPITIKVTFRFPEFVSVCKKAICSIVSYFRYSQFWSAVTRVVTPIFDHIHPNIFNKILISMSLHQHTNKSSYFAQEIYLILKSGNLFGPYLRNQDSSKICNLCRNIANNISFHNRPFS